MNWYKVSKLNNSIHPHIFVNIPKSRQQTNYTCGVAALRSIARYYGRDCENEKEMAELCNAGKVKGVYPENIVEAAEKLGLNAEINRGMTIESLTDIVSQGIPVICEIQAWGDKEDYYKLNDGHYVVAIGFDDANIYFEDPSSDKTRRFIPKKEFLSRWIDREAWIDNPVNKRLGVIITCDEKPSKEQKIDKFEKLP